VMLRGIASFGLRHVLRTDESLSLSEDPPVAIAGPDRVADTRLARHDYSVRTQAQPRLSSVTSTAT